MLTKLIVIIILQYIHVPNHLGCHIPDTNNVDVNCISVKLRGGGSQWKRWAQRVWSIEKGVIKVMGHGSHFF